MADNHIIYRFGRFRLDPQTRTLEADGQPLAISSRAFDILLYLVQSRDRVATKDEIIDHVWQGVIVEENNLAVQISGLRRALGDRTGGQQLIVTIPGRGYRLVGEVEELGGDPVPAVPAEIEPAGGAAGSGEPLLVPVVAAVPASVLPPPAASRVRLWWFGAGAALVAFAIIAYLSFRPGVGEKLTGLAVGGEPPRLSLAVMPFRNMSGDAEQDYLADAISDDLTIDLSRLPGSRVIARASADTYRGRQTSPVQIAHELGVRYLIDGSMRQSGDRVLVNAALIGEGGDHLWADRFDVLRTQFTDIETTIVQHLSSALNFKLVQIEGQRSIHDRPNNPDALDLFLRARSILDRDNRLEGLTAAQPMLEKAIQLQPDFVDAMSELAWLLLTKASEFDDPTDVADMKEANDLVAHALELAPQNVVALSARGMLLAVEWRCDEAAASAHIALSIDPNSVLARTGLARCADDLGHPEETVRLLREILALDPQNPRNRARYHQLGLAILMLGRPEDAVGWLQQAAAAYPDPDEFNEMALIAARAMAGHTSEAQAEYAAYNRLWPNRTVWRLGCYASRAQSALPGFRQVLDGLKAAGMPLHADETRDDGSAPVAIPQARDAYETTPMTIPGARATATGPLKELLTHLSSPLILDVGCGGAAIPGAVRLSWARDDPFTSEASRARLVELVAAETKGDKARPIVLESSSIYGWSSYNAALQLNASGYTNLIWYRGGEEAWAAAGLEAQDLRKP